MTKQKLLILVVIFLALCGAMLLVERADNHDSENASVALFSDLDVGAIAQLKIEQGSEALQLVVKNGVWSVPARADYPADFGKVRALLLKLLGLSVSQQVTDNAEKFPALGVADTSVAEGRSRITLFDSNQKELAGVILGEARKRKPDSQPFAAQGQYLRRTGKNQVYLVADAVTASPNVAEWLDHNILNVLQSSVEGISQYRKDGQTEIAEFELTRVPSTEPGETTKLALREIPNGAQIQEPKISQISSGLENLRLSDVFKSDNEKVRDLVYVSKSVIRAQNGLIYTVQSVVKEGEDKGYLTFEVSFDGELAKGVAARIEQLNAAQPKPESGEAPSTSKTKQTAPAPSSTDEAANLNARLKGWVFEVPNYIAKKFTVTMNDLIKKEEPKPEAPQS